jgi:hypothetical protein
MNREATIILMCAASAVAQPKFSAPLAGIARDSNQQLRILHAVSGTFILHDGIGETVVSWAFDGNSGLVKTDAELLTIGANGAITARRSAPQQETVLGPRTTFFPETHEFWQTEPNGETKNIDRTGNDCRQRDCAGTSKRSQCTTRRVPGKRTMAAFR